MTDSPQVDSSEPRRKRVKVQEEIVSSLRVARVNPWSVAFNSFLASIVLAITLTLFTVLFWYAFDSMGIFDKVVTTLAPEGDGAATLHAWFSLKKFVLIGGGLSAALVVIIPVASFFATVTFNLIAKLTGGVKIDLGNQRN